jgi:DNA-binding FadR family transcriptional regulator
MSETRHDTIADTLCREILRGRYCAGDRLQSERELASRFAANRGAVREAVKKLEQMGLVDVQPGGARVQAVEDSSLEVVGRLLALEEIPDPDLVDQVLTVMNALMRLATEQALRRASERELEVARALVRRLRQVDLPFEERMQARLDLGRQIMQMSGNLALGLIANTLRVQIFRNAAAAARIVHARSDDLEHHLVRLEAALLSRDVDAAVATLQSITDSNREQVVRALRLARAQQHDSRTDTP